MALLTKLSTFNKDRFGNEKEMIRFWKQWSVFLLYCSNYRHNRTTVSGILEVV